MNKIIRLAMTVIMMAACTAMVSAQEKTKERQRMTREQLAETQAKYIANALALSDEDAAKYIATYTECQKEIWALGPRAKKNRQNMTEEETKQAIQQRMEHSEKLLSIRKKYYKEYSKFLTQKQIERACELEKSAMKRLFAKRNAKVRKNTQKQGKPGMRRPVRPAKQKTDSVNK